MNKIEKWITVFAVVKQLGNLASLHIYFIFMYVYFRPEEKKSLRVE